MMAASPDFDPAAAISELAHRERLARDLLVDARARLADRDAVFAVIEAELWSDFEAHERRSQDRIRALEAELEQARTGLEASRSEVSVLNETVATLHGQVIALSLRLDRLFAIPPVRLIRRLAELPVVRAVSARRARGYQAELRRRVGE